MIIRKKVITVGCGVVLSVPGTRFLVNAEVTGLDEAQQIIKVKVPEEAEGWVPVSQVINVIDPGAYALDNALNVIGRAEE